MKSGYDVTIKAFVPCDPMEPGTMKAALAEIDRLLEYVSQNQATVAIAKTKFVRRREDDGC